MVLNLPAEGAPPSGVRRVTGPIEFASVEIDPALRVDRSNVGVCAIRA